MLNVSLTTNPETLTGIYTYLRNEFGLVAESEEDAQNMMKAYLNAFIEKYGVDVALTDGLLVPTETM
jgi:hypothetical protein